MAVGDLVAGMAEVMQAEAVMVVAKGAVQVEAVPGGMAMAVIMAEVVDEAETKGAVAVTVRRVAAVVAQTVAGANNKERGCSNTLQTGSCAPSQYHQPASSAPQRSIRCPMSAALTVTAALLSARKGCVGCHSPCPWPWRSTDGSCQTRCYPTVTGPMAPGLR